jgi:quercetin dioxygenase-like cupin family protein
LALTAGETFENPRTGGRLTVTRREDDLLEVERLYKPRTGKAGPHVHLDFVQSFEVLDGTASVSLDGDERKLAAGQTLEVPKGVKHVDAWNAEDGDLRVRLRFTPVPLFVETYTERAGDLIRRDALNKRQEVPMLQLFVVLHATKGQSFGAGPPIAMQRALLPLLAAIGRLRGFRA